MPIFTGQHGIEGKVLGGWEVSGITSAESGQSLTATQSADPFALYPGGLGISTPDTDIAPRPDQVAPVHLLKTQAQWFATSSFALASGHFGSARNGIFLGPGYQNWDIGAIKNIAFYERYRFQFRGEFFNAFNHTNFAGINSNVSDSLANGGNGAYGTVTSTHLPREIQLGAKIYF